MKADKETVKKMAHLARLEFEGNEDEMVNGMNEMLDFVEKLKELNTEGIEPLSHISSEINIMREDEVKHTISHEEALMNAPKKDSDYIRVPKVLE
jgi:aspartyl-tRNA(Asn)/glutamyl-tRNA(Gln) amidotransferase subunit C